MYKGVTPTLTLQFTEDAQLEQAEEIIVTISNSVYDPIIEITDVTVEDNSIIVELTQAQTLSLPTGCKIQANWTYAGGKRACSEVKQFTMSNNLHPEVI